MFLQQRFLLQICTVTKFSTETSFLSNIVHTQHASVLKLALPVFVKIAAPLTALLPVAVTVVRVREPLSR